MEYTRLEFKIEPSEKKRLNELAKANGLTLSALIRLVLARTEKI